jgi:hypothetical protein
MFEGEGLFSKRASSKKSTSILQKDLQYKSNVHFEGGLPVQI